MKEAINKVFTWQSYFGRDNGVQDHTIALYPKCVNKETAQARIDFILEELEEYRVSNEAGDIVGVLDAILDILYFAFGMIVIHGLHNIADKGFDIVHKANMSKLWPGNVVKITANGKVLKPDTFIRPEPELEKLFDR